MGSDLYLEAQMAAPYVAAELRRENGELIGERDRWKKLAEDESLAKSLASDRATCAESRANALAQKLEASEAGRLEEERLKFEALQELDESRAHVRELEERGRHVDGEVRRICAERAEIGERAAKAGERILELEASRERCRSGKHLLILARCEDCGISARQLHAESEARALRERIERADRILVDEARPLHQRIVVALEVLRGS